MLGKTGEAVDIKLVNSDSLLRGCCQLLAQVGHQAALVQADGDSKPLHSLSQGPSLQDGHWRRHLPVFPVEEAERGEVGGEEGKLPQLPARIEKLAKCTETLFLIFKILIVDGETLQLLLMTSDG